MLFLSTIGACYEVRFGKSVAYKKQEGFFNFRFDRCFHDEICFMPVSDNTIDLNDGFASTITITVHAASIYQYSKFTVLVLMRFILASSTKSI